mmetsp:Transcript_56111/g.111512  ORF Transcript_56111/g.111512 Transcript_56111/m.111512 type:complete len:88 (-) Transcript_56111:781-1044(-)
MSILVESKIRSESESNNALNQRERPLTKAGMATFIKKCITLAIVTDATEKCDGLQAYATAAVTGSVNAKAVPNNLPIEVQPLKHGLA